MSAPRTFVVPPDTLTNQERASDPAASAWVEANAGSGKTFVLTRRVLRLLVSGAAPNALLCLTYTKAAAAEMRQRVTGRLAKWARLDEAGLKGELEDTLGRAPAPEEATRARALFARALETPGGLKINTIHAFCEAILQRFPREAGVPVDFSVLPEDEGAELLTAAREAVLAEGLKGAGPCPDAIAVLFDELSDHQIERAISHALQGGRRLEAVLADPDAAQANLRTMLALAPEDTAEAIAAAATGEMLVPASDWPQIFSICQPDPEKTRFEDKLYALDTKALTAQALFSVYLTGDGAVPKNFPKGAFKKADPDLAERLEAEAHRLAGLCDKLKAARILKLSGALTRVAKAILDAYEARKRARSLMDFDDLVAHTVRLLNDKSVSAWVRYKLDAGIDHILVDESQDTNPDQWAVITALADDFFAGEGTGRPKTLFAVGDPKQSIYSFQGAEPALFRETGRDFARRAAASGETFRQIPFRTSFRSLPGILEAADKVATRPDIAAALFASDDPVRHESARAEPGGSVTLWPTFPKPEKLAPDEAWPLEPVENIQSPTRQIGNKIAETIRGWISGDLPSPIGRKVVPEDILILVQNRTGVFGEIVSALKKAQISSPGADRLPVSAHIAVDDLLGLADILLNPSDDLLLAAVLRSPLYGVTEDELFELAHYRGKDETLWAALGKSEIASAVAAREELTALRARLDLDRPYAFFAHLLYAREGLKRFHTRLGQEVDEVIAEFLDLALEHETSDQPSLTGFVARMRASEVVIKRDLIQSAAGVRIMTVHGAKGLEAPIVILADATATSKSPRDSVFYPDSGQPPFLLYCPGKDHDCSQSRPLRDMGAEKARAEYWRNLYVAMTRAEDALFVTGATNDKDSRKNTWYEALDMALAPEAVVLGEAVGMPGGVRYGAAAVAAGAEDAREERTSDAPFSRGAPVRKPVVPVLTPSGLGEKSGSGEPLATAGDMLLDAPAARRRGIALHALLQHLSNVPQERRETVALAAAQTLLPDFPDLAPGVAEAALAILADPYFAPLFGPHARAEVAFSLGGTRNGSPIRLEGRIDRLVVDEEGALVVDFKSDAAPPQSADTIPPAYRTQLGLYKLAVERLLPGVPVRAAILWTAMRELMVLDPAALEEAISGVTLA